MVATSLKAMAEDKTNENVKKKTIFQASPLVVQEKKGFNKRDYASEKVEAQIESFAQSYQNKVFVPAWVVWVEEDGTILVLEGHLRRRGCLRAIKRGTAIPFVDLVPFQGTWSEAIQLMLLSQEGLKFEVLEFAMGVLDLKNEGHTNQAIAPMVKRTPARVEQLLKLATASPEIHEMVRSGKVEAEAAILAIREHGENAAAALQGMVTEVEEQGGKKVNRGTMRGPSLPPKVLSAVIGSLESVVGRLDGSTRLKLAEYESLPPDQLKGKTIEIDVESLLELVKAQGEVIDVKAKRDAAAQAKKSADAQQDLLVDGDAGPEVTGVAQEEPVVVASQEAAVELSPEQYAALRVYGGVTQREGVQVRTVVATFTQKDAAKLVGVPLSQVRSFWTTTTDPVEIEVAKSHPEKVLIASSINGADFKLLG